MEMGSKDEGERPGRRGPSSSRHIGLLKRAEEFAKAATIVEAHAPINKAPIATYYLCGHAIELALKSVLRLHGDSDKCLRKIGHDLDCALRRATSHPQKRFFSEELKQAVKILKPYYSKKDFEYYDDPGVMTLLELRELVEIVNKLIENLDKDYRTLWRNRPGAGGLG